VKNQHLSAIILAAGLSSRMGRFKPLLPLGPVTVVERVSGLYRGAGINDICVVTGHQADAVRAVLAPHGVRWVENKDYAQGMFSSLVAGIGALPAESTGFFVHPVDIPLVRRSTVTALAQRFQDDPEAVLHPTFDGRRGHPPLVPAGLAPAILRWSGQGGLRGFWNCRPIAMKEMPVADEAILLDLDTEAHHQKMLNRMKNQDLPTTEECRVLMTQVADVPEPVWRHCLAAAAVAVDIAAAVNHAGGSLDLDLVRSAALVHDIAKTEQQHAAAGAKLLESLGYPAVAAVVRVHMDIETTPEQPLDEAQIVFLADKLLEGPHLCSLDDRMARKLTKYGNDNAAREAIGRRFQMARRIQEKIERLSGGKVQAILSQIGP
jgi:molybdenum cofactor cytidylyltransferase